MADKKDLQDIRPAKGGVKIQKKQRSEKQKQQAQPKVIQDVRPDIPMENLPSPTDEAIRFMTQLSEAKQVLIDAMQEFNKLLKNRKLVENRSVKENENEQDVVNQLAVAAIGVEGLNPGEGLLGICILAVRQALVLRDAGNTLAYETFQLKERITTLERRIDGIENDVYESPDA
jgi:hypothetical protein